MTSIAGDCVALIEGLGPKVVEGDLVDFFFNVGELKAVRFGKDSLTGRPTGTAYCIFESNEQVQKAILLNNESICGAPVKVKEVPTSALRLTLSETTANKSEDQKPLFVQNPNYRLPGFSGGPKQKGEVGFETWKHEIECLTKDEGCPPDQLARLARLSLRGEAAQIILSMGLDATAEEMVLKLEGFYGTIESGAVLPQQLYCSKQAANEPVATFSARLQLLIDRAEKRGGVPSGTKEETLRIVFWKGLTDEGVKQAIRYKYDQIVSFDELVREARRVEQELADFKESRATGSARQPQRAQHQPASATVDMQAQGAKKEAEAKAAREISELRKRLEQLETAAKEQQPMRPPMVRPRGPCYRCGGQGHLARECLVPPQPSRGQGVPPQRYPYVPHAPQHAQGHQHQPPADMSAQSNAQGPPPWGGQWTQNLPR